MESDEKAVVAGSLIVVVVIAGVFLFMPNIFACLGQSCLGSGGQNPITGAQSIYFDITTTRGLFSVGINGQILPNAGATGEIVKSCQWVTCELTGTEVTDTITITGPKAFSETWTFRLGLGDKEEYVWLAPAMPTGTYTVTVTDGSGARASGSFTIPLSNSVQLTGG